MVLHSKFIGNKLTEARKILGLSQAQLAQHISISPQAVGKWERGESLPDILTLNKLAEILKVDLNYFSDSFPSNTQDETSSESASNLQKAETIASPKKRFDWNWDMSGGNWQDADFSGLKNLKEKFSSSNMKNCKFRDSDLSGLILAKNNIEQCDFTASDLRDSKIHSSNLQGNLYNQASFIDAEFYKSNISKCNFSQSNLSGTEFLEVNFEHNVLNQCELKFTSFKRSNLSHLVFEGLIEDCHFEHCGFHNVRFENVTIRSSFFKYNKRFNKVQFINCVADNISYAFLKNNKANLSGISLIS